MERKQYITPQIYVVKIDTVMPIAGSIQYEEGDDTLNVDVSDVNENVDQSTFLAPENTNLWEN